MIQDQRGFSEGGSWFKGNLHSHTTNSDGRLSPGGAVGLYREHGYHFLCFSEHDLYTDYRGEFDRSDFIILPGLEASAVLCEERTGRALKVHHIHGILGTQEMQQAAGNACFGPEERVEPLVYHGEWDGAAAGGRLTAYLKGRGCFTIYNHPVWSRVEAGEFSDCGFWGLEIFNYNTVNESNTGYDTTYWDCMLRRGRRVAAVATDDNHNEGLFEDACGGWIMVKAPELSHEAIVKNIMSGNFYSSSGPEILDWGVRDGTAYVESSPVCRIDFVAGNHVNDGGSILSGTGKDLIERGEYRLKGDESYLRVQCTDCCGRTAWSNPLYGM